MKRILLCCLFVVVASCAQEERLRFKIAESAEATVASPVSIDVSTLKGDTFQLLNGQRYIPFDYDPLARKIWFVQHPDRSADYELVAIEKEAVEPHKLTAAKSEGDLRLFLGKKPLIEYRYGMIYPPEGIDTLFKKSGYIHPIRTPKGDTLTRIQPPDHYHHYGLWGPWTHTRIDTMRVDFWNLGEGMGTVLFKEFKGIRSGAVHTSFTAAQEHIDFKTKEKPQVALNERLQIRLWDLERPDRYMFDYTTTFESPLETGILFEAYRYGGGIGLRFHERWKADNCTVLTSEGKDRLTADGSNARWCIVTGASSDGTGTNGILFMSYPENRMHPEPMRIWPIDGNNGRGDMFFEFCPIRHKEWRIAPEKKYELKYRMVVFDGTLTAAEAEAYWQAFANTPQVQRITD